MISKRRFFRNQKVMFKRGASILPSIFTLFNMLLGYMAIIFATKGNFENSVNLCLVAGILDLLDGRIARMTGTSSEFGKELDSLADFLSFGIAPALILYYWGFSELGKFGWLFVFLLPVAGAIRLARFNIQTQIVDKHFFVGLPIPAAAASALFPLYFLDNEFLQKIKSDYSHQAILGIKAIALIYVVVIAFLMVSTIKYRSFKDFDIKRRKPAPFFFFLMFFIVVIVLHPQAVLLILSLIYLFSGPVFVIYERLFKKSIKEEVV